MTIQLLKQAERNDDGDLIYEKEYETRSGGKRTEKTNVSELLQPGKRTTGDVDILVYEAKQAAERGVDNPAYPATADVANEACRKIIDNLGLEPAWKDHEPTEWY